MPQFVEGSQNRVLAMRFSPLAKLFLAETRAERRADGTNPEGP